MLGTSIVFTPPIWHHRQVKTNIERHIQTLQTHMISGGATHPQIIAVVVLLYRNMWRQKFIGE